MWHKYSSSDTTYTFTFGTSGKAAGVMVAYSGAYGATPINASNSQLNASSATLTAPSITTTVPNTMLVGLYATAVGTTLTQGSSMTLRGQTTSSGGGSGGTKIAVGAQDIIQASATSSGTKVMTGTAAVNTGALVALVPAPILEQASYRFFANTDSATASTTLQSTDTGVTVERGVPLRLRLNLGVSSAPLSSGANLILQYAQYDGSSCSTSTFQALGATNSGNPVRYYDNPSVADDTTYVTSANDPTRSGVTSNGQFYVESVFSTRTTIPVGQDGLWDFSIMLDANVVYGQMYCLRVVNIDNSQIATYTKYPTITAATPTVSQANYRWFTNADNVAPGSALASQDTVASVVSQSVTRLRQRIAIDQSAVPLNYRNYKLQYAQKVSTCNPAVSGESYQDVMPAPSTATGNVSAYTMNIGTDTLNWSGTLQSDLSAPGDGQRVTAATKSLSAQVTKYLAAYGYGFSIPTTATITGIEVTPYTYFFTPNFGGANMASANLYQGGSVLGTSQSQSESLNFSPFTIGSSSNTWGVSLTPAIVNSSDFGIAVRISVSGDGTQQSTGGMDSLGMKVYYTTSTGTEMVAYANNASVADATTISSATGDPINGARPTVYENYRETDPFSNAAALIANGSDGLWDFAIKPGTSAEGTTLCFRVVDTTNALLNTYAQYPQLIVTPPGTGPTLDQQLRGGSSVVSGTKGPFTW
jgi:hypothetical protein